MRIAHHVLALLLCFLMLGSCSAVNKPGISAGIFADAVARGDYATAQEFLAASVDKNIAAPGQWDVLKNHPNYRYKLISQSVRGNRAEVKFNDPQGTERTLFLIYEDEWWVVQSLK